MLSAAGQVPKGRGKKENAEVKHVHFIHQTPSSIRWPSSSGKVRDQERAIGLHQRKSLHMET